MKISGSWIAAAAITFGTGPAVARSAQQQSAEAFVRSLYGGRSWRSLLTADTARLQRSAESLTRDEVPEYLDGDPLCACQDDSGLRVLSVRSARTSGGLTRVTVRFDFADVPREPDRTVRLLLARNGRSWRIHDVLFPAGRRTISYRWALRREGGS